MSISQPCVASFLAAEHLFPTLGAALGSRRCQGMESRATAAVGEPANTFSCGMQRIRHLILPFFPSASPSALSPAARAERAASFLPSSSFQRTSGLQTCLCITLFASNCYCLHWTRSRAWVETEHSDLFYCWGTMAR